MKKLFLICCLLLINSLIAQTRVLTDTLDINQIGQQEGLLQLNIKAMAFDDLGYLWTGTEDGLYRFNGYKFKPFLHDPVDSNSIKDDHIRGLLYTKDTLFTATNTEGIIGFIPSKESFFDLLPSEINAELKTSYQILNLGNNLLLFSVKNHIILFNRQNKKTDLIRLPQSPKENFITAVLQINKNNYWLASSATGVITMNTKTLEVNKSKILQNKHINCFYQLNDQIFIGANDGLFIYNLKTQQTTKTSLNLSVKCFYPLKNNQLYLGTAKGLFLFDTDKNITQPVILKTNTGKLLNVIDINQIIGDHKGNIWLGTEGKGLLHHNAYQKKFQTIKLSLIEYPFIDNISSFQFLKEKDSSLWIGSKYGVVKYSPLKKTFKLYKNTRDQLIYTIVRDNNNTIWAGGFTTGLLKYDKKQDRFNRISKMSNALPDDDVIEIIPIEANTLWICTWSGGIFKFDITEESFEELLVEGKSLNRARTSLIDSKGNIWLGTDQGVYKISKQGTFIKRYHKKDSDGYSISSDRIFSIQEDQDENIWIGTSVGLTKLNVKSDRTTLFFKQEGLPNDFIYSVLIAKNNDIWLSTNYGISVLNQIKKTFKNYTVSDGLQNIEFNGKAGYKDEFGNFYFGGLSGINIFNPNKIKENPFVPNIYIESVDLFNKPISKNELFRDSLKFKSNENVITFNYAALNFINPNKTNYTFKLDGFDLDWRPVTKDRSTTYTNLDSGSYTFKVMASNDAGIWNEKPAIMHILIIPPWYKTWIFKSSVLLLFLLAGPLFYIFKTKKLKKDKLKLEKIISERTREISLKNQDLEKVNIEVKKQNNRIKFLMREMSHRIKNNLQIISSLLNIQANTLDYKPATEAIKVAKNRILAISHVENLKRNNDETVQIDLFIKNLTNSIITSISDKEKLKFKIVYDLQATKIDHLNTTLLGLILNELITNTIKYAFDDYHPDNTLKISCKVNKDSLRLAVSDNGKGYLAKTDVSKESLGIELVTEMVKQLKGTIVINSKNGTDNTIEIPI